MKLVTRLSLLLVVLATGCARTDERRGGAGELCACEPSAHVVDAELLAWLSKSRSLHHLADLAENDDHPERALAALDQLVKGPVPKGSAKEIDEVLADTFARLAELEARRGEFDAARGHVEQGLERAKGESYFRGHLFEVRGLVLERLSKLRATEGKQAESNEAREQAIAASLEAVRIQNAVIERTLGDAGRRP